MIDCDDSCCALPLGFEGVIAVPRAYVEHSPTRQRGKTQRRELVRKQLGRLVAVGDDAVAEADRVSPLGNGSSAPCFQGVTIRLHTRHLAPERVSAEHGGTRGRSLLRACLSRVVPSRPLSSKLNRARTPDRAETNAMVALGGG